MLVRKMLLLCAFVLTAISSFTQDNIAKLRNTLEKSGEDTGKVSLLVSLSRYYDPLNLDTAILLAHQGYELSKKKEYARGEAVCLNILGELYMKKDNYFFGLQTEINALKIFEKLEDDRGIAATYYSIGNIYERVGDYDQALNNFTRCRSRAAALADSILLMNCYSSLGYNYYKIDNPDSASKYAQMSYDIARIKKNNVERLPWALALLGAVQDKMGNPAIAMAYYYDAISKARAFNQESLFPYVYQVMAELYKHTTLVDSAILYGERALEISQKLSFTKGIADASIFLANLYTGLDNNKAVDYFKLAAQLRDSVFSVQKINQVQGIAYTEELRQAELEKERSVAAEERKNNIQYAAIAIGVIAFLIIFLLMSHSIIVNAKLIGFFGVVALLVVFEFVNLIIHPYLAHFTNHSPLLMLGALVLIAALLVPAHHYLQKWITHKLVEKNNRIRLAAARKVIASFENKTKP